MANTNETTTVNLTNDIRVNTRLYKAGHNVIVPKDQADDIMRMDHEHNKYKSQLLTKQTYETNAGTMAVGSGAE